MTTLYLASSLYGNYLDGYFVRNYEEFIEELVEEATEKRTLNLGITDGVTIINVLKGDFTKYNCVVVERENGDRDLYKITDKQFIRRDVWQITMVLDAFSKYYDKILDSSVLVERLGIENFNSFNPMLFNDEGFTLSEVKKRQIGLNFDGLTGLEEGQSLGGYLMFIQKGRVAELTLDNIQTSAPTTADYEIANIESFTLYQNRTVTTDIEIYPLADYTGKADTNNNPRGYYEFYDWRTANKYAIHIERYFLSDKTTVESWCLEDQEDHDYLWATDIWEAHYSGNYVKSNFAERGVFLGTGNFTEPQPAFSLGAFLTEIYSYAKTNWQTGLDESYYSQYNNKVIKDTSQGTYYRISFGSANTLEYTRTITDQTEIDALFQISCYQYEDTGITFRYKETTRQATFTLLGRDSTSGGVLAPTHTRSTLDEGYYCLWIPKCNNILGNWDETMVLEILNQFRETYGGDNPIILDVQETYFVPQEIQDKFKVNNGIIEYNGSTSDNNWWVQENNGLVIWLGYWLDYSVGSIETDIEIEVENYKIEQLYDYILRSPSGSSTFDFNIARNNGLKGFTLNYSLRPYKSMYQVQPLFNGFYGTNFKDSRGLVMTEDTSLTQRSDLYETYKRQNINYINSFNSNQAYERTRLDVQQDYEREQMKLRSTSNMITAYENALGQGLESINEIGKYDVSAINSGIRAGEDVAQGVTNTAIEWAEFKNRQRQQRQQLMLKQNEARKQWKYSIDNMKALPYNTDKIDAIYQNNTHQFILEEYTPTDYELLVYRTYISLYGINIGQPIDLSLYDNFTYIEGNVIVYVDNITNEEYQEIQDELVSGRRLYNGESTDNETI